MTRSSELALKIKVARNMLSERQRELRRARAVTTKAKAKVAAIEAELRAAKDALFEAEVIQSAKQNRVWVQWDYMERENIKESA